MKPTKFDRMEIDLQPSVYLAVVTMYDRYHEVTTVSKVPMDFPDFFNQLVVRGLIEYNEPLADIEKKLGIT